MATMTPSNERTNPRDGNAGREAHVRVCLISMGGELYAVEMASVREVFEVESITPVPGMPPALVGVANLRGIVIPLVDLRSILGMPIDGPTPAFAVVIQQGVKQIGILVEQVPEIRTVRREQFLPAVKDGHGAARPFVSAVLRIEDRLGGVLEVPMVVEHVEAQVS